MESLPSIQQLFLPLAKRLLQYEAGKYQYNFEFVEDRDYDEMIDYISTAVNVYDDVEVVQTARQYERRVMRLLTNLVPRELTYRVNPRTQEVETTETTEETKRILMAEWKAELTIYLEHLQMMQEVRYDVSTENAQPRSSLEPMEEEKTVTDDTLLQIQLPMDFKVTNIKKHFEPILSIKQSGLFLYYLRETKLIPPFSNRSLGLLAKTLFARNPQNVKDEVFTPIVKVKEDANLLKSLIADTLDRLSARIKEDLT